VTSGRPRFVSPEALQAAATTRCATNVSTPDVPLFAKSLATIQFAPCPTVTPPAAVSAQLLSFRLPNSGARAAAASNAIATEVLTIAPPDSAGDAETDGGLQRPRVSSVSLWTSVEMSARLACEISGQKRVRLVEELYVGPSQHESAWGTWAGQTGRSPSTLKCQVTSVRSVDLSAKPL
jgi:hypothetical protein